MNAGRGDREAFGSLYTAYASTLVVYLRYKGNGAEQAMDLVQGFFEHLLKTNALSSVEQTGRFRNWLRKTLNNFVRDEHAKRVAQKRGAGKTHLPVGPDFEEGAVEPLDMSLTPEQAYDRKWAIALINRALRRLSDEFTKEGKGLVFERLKVFLSGKSEGDDYEQAGRDTNIKPNTVAVIVKRMRERYGVLLLDEIGETVGPESVAEEWLHLQQAICGRPANEGHGFQA